MGFATTLFILFTFWKESIRSQATNLHSSELFVDCKHRSTSNSCSLFTCVDLSFPFLCDLQWIQMEDVQLQTHHQVNPSRIVFSLQSTVASNGMYSKNVEIRPRTNQLNLNGLIFVTAGSSSKRGMPLLQKWNTPAVLKLVRLYKLLHPKTCHPVPTHRHFSTYCFLSLIASVGPQATTTSPFSTIDNVVNWRIYTHHQVNPKLIQTKALLSNQSNTTPCAAYNASTRGDPTKAEQKSDSKLQKKHTRIKQVLGMGDITQMVMDLVEIET